MQYPPRKDNKIWSTIDAADNEIISLMLYSKIAGNLEFYSQLWYHPRIRANGKSKPSSEIQTIYFWYFLSYRNS